MDDKDCKQIKGELQVESNEGGGVKFGDDGKTAFSEDRSAYSSMFYAIPRATVRRPFLLPWTNSTGMYERTGAHLFYFPQTDYR